MNFSWWKYAHPKIQGERYKYKIYTILEKTRTNIDDQPETLSFGDSMGTDDYQKDFPWKVKIT